MEQTGDSRRIRVAGASIGVDNVQHGASGLVHERLIPKCTGEQLQGLPGLVEAALRKPLFVQRAATLEMLAQGLSGPDSELRSTQ